MNALERAALRVPEAGPAGLAGEVRPDLLRDEVLAEIFSASARENPDRVALIFGERRFTYREVDEAADAIARGLVRRGIGPRRHRRPVDVRAAPTC